MNQHDDIRDLLTLAAAGALDAGQQRLVEEHLRQCEACRNELELWRQLTGALEALPTPPAPPGLVESTRRQLELRATDHAEHRQMRNLLVWLTVFGWVSTVLTWPLFEWGGGLAGMLGVSVGEAAIMQSWIGYIVVTWTVSAIVAGLLGQRRRYDQEGSVV